MTPYEFRTIFHGKTIWTVEQYFLDDSEALAYAAKANVLFETQVWKSTVRLTRVIH
jgi:hypothetical protein